MTKATLQKYAFWIDALATCGFVGKIRFAPGTCGTMWGVPIGLALASCGPMVYIIGTALLIGLAIFSAQLHESLHGGHDASEIVIDEVVGYLVAFALLPWHWSSIFGAFVLFRIFDIIKPFPISWLDRRVKGGLGVVVDDLAAGLVANIILQLGLPVLMAHLMPHLSPYLKGVLE